MKKIIILLFLAACTQTKKPIDAKIKLFYLKVQYGRPVDTLAYEHFNNRSSDSLITSDDFVYKDTYHSIKFYTNSFNCVVDGGEDNYCVDKLGIIYLRSTTWPTYFRLKSNNDSLNDLIQFAMDKILLKKKLQSYPSAPPVRYKIESSNK